MRQREDGFGLSLRIGVENVGLNVAFILEQAVEDVDCLPDAARDEMAEQSDVGIGDMVVADTAVSSVTDVILREKILLVQIPSCAIGGSVFARSPQSGNREVVIGVDNCRDGLIQSVLGDVPLIDPGNLPAIRSLD